MNITYLDGEDLAFLIRHAEAARATGLPLRLIQGRDGRIITKRGEHVWTAPYGQRHENGGPR